MASPLACRRMCFWMGLRFPYTESKNFKTNTEMHKAFMNSPPTGRTWTDGTDVDGLDGTDVDGRERRGRTWTDGTDVEGRGRTGRDGTNVDGRERTAVDGRDLSSQSIII